MPTRQAGFALAGDGISEVAYPAATGYPTLDDRGFTLQPRPKQEEMETTLDNLLGDWCKNTPKPQSPKAYSGTVYDAVKAVRNAEPKIASYWNRLPEEKATQYQTEAREMAGGDISETEARLSTQFLESKGKFLGPVFGVLEKHGWVPTPTGGTLKDYNTATNNMKEIHDDLIKCLPAMDFDFEQTIHINLLAKVGKGWEISEMCQKIGFRDTTHLKQVWEKIQVGFRYIETLTAAKNNALRDEHSKRHLLGGEKAACKKIRAQYDTQIQEFITGWRKHITDGLKWAEKALHAANPHELRHPVKAYDHDGIPNKYSSLPDPGVGAEKSNPKKTKKKTKIKPNQKLPTELPDPLGAVSLTRSQRDLATAFTDFFHHFAAVPKKKDPSFAEYKTDYIKNLAEHVARCEDLIKSVFHVEIEADFKIFSRDYTREHERQRLMSAANWIDQDLSDKKMKMKPEDQVKQFFLRLGKLSNAVISKNENSFEVSGVDKGGRPWHGEDERLEKSYRKLINEVTHKNPAEHTPDLALETTAKSWAGEMKSPWGCTVPCALAVAQRWKDYHSGPSQTGKLSTYLEGVQNATSGGIGWLLKDEWRHIGRACTSLRKEEKAWQERVTIGPRLHDKVISGKSATPDLRRWSLSVNPGDLPRLGKPSVGGFLNSVVDKSKHGTGNSSKEHKSDATSKRLRVAHPNVSKNDKYTNKGPDRDFLKKGDMEHTAREDVAKAKEILNKAIVEAMQRQDQERAGAPVKLHTPEKDGTDHLINVTDVEPPPGTPIPSYELKGQVEGKLGDTFWAPENTLTALSTTAPAMPPKFKSGDRVLFDNSPQKHPFCAHGPLGNAICSGSIHVVADVLPFTLSTNQVVYVNGIGSCTVIRVFGRTVKVKKLKSRLQNTGFVSAVSNKGIKEAVALETLTLKMGVVMEIEADHRAIIERERPIAADKANADGDATDDADQVAGAAPQAAAEKFYYPVTMSETAAVDYVNKFWLFGVKAKGGAQHAVMPELIPFKARKWIWVKGHKRRLWYAERAELFHPMFKKVVQESAMDAFGKDADVKAYFTSKLKHWFGMFPTTRPGGYTCNVCNTKVLPTRIVTVEQQPDLTWKRLGQKKITKPGIWDKAQQLKLLKDNAKLISQGNFPKLPGGGTKQQLYKVERVCQGYFCHHRELDLQCIQNLQRTYAVCMSCAEDPNIAINVGSDETNNQESDLGMYDCHTAEDNEAFASRFKEVVPGGADSANLDLVATKRLQQVDPVTAQANTTESTKTELARSETFKTIGPHEKFFAAHGYANEPTNIEKKKAGLHKEKKMSKKKKKKVKAEGTVVEDDVEELDVSNVSLSKEEILANNAKWQEWQKVLDYRFRQTKDCKTNKLTVTMTYEAGATDMLKEWVDAGDASTLEAAGLSAGTVGAKKDEFFCKLFPVGEIKGERKEKRCKITMRTFATMLGSFIFAGGNINAWFDSASDANREAAKIKEEEGMTKEAQQEKIHEWERKGDPLAHASQYVLSHMPP